MRGRPLWIGQFQFHHFVALLNPELARPAAKLDVGHLQVVAADDPGHRGELHPVVEVEHLGADFTDYQREHDAYHAARAAVLAVLEAHGRYQVIERGFLPNFLFAPADVVLALGQDVDLSLLHGVNGLEVRDGVVQVGPDMMTGHPGLFAGGDMVPSERTVTVAVGHGKKAARHIDAWLRGKRYEPAPKHEIAKFDKLNTWYYLDAPKTVQPVLDIIRRQSTFEEVLGGLDEHNALFEARRCLSCGNCFECDNCYGVCPDNAVIKLGPGKRFEFNYDYCKGCGLCVSECPCGAIRTQPARVGKLMGAARRHPADALVGGHSRPG